MIKNSKSKRSRLAGGAWIETVYPHKKQKEVKGRASQGARGLKLLHRNKVCKSDECRASQEKRIAGAALDVFVDEPNVPVELFAMDNVVLTPHMASGTLQTRTAMANLAVANLVAHFSGQPLPTPIPR